MDVLNAKEQLLLLPVKPQLMDIILLVLLLLNVQEDVRNVGQRPLIPILLSVLNVMVMDSPLLPVPHANLDMLMMTVLLLLEFALGKLMMLNICVLLATFGINLLTQLENVLLKLPTVLLDIQLMELI